jgi:predicted P-loop ATPase
MTVTQQKEAHKSVTDYLAFIVWDGRPRLDRWLIDYAGAEDSTHVRMASRVMLVAAVRRARHPGCRFDQMPVLEGPQGCGKSSALRVLAVEASWFTDEFPFNASGMADATAGKWIVEVNALNLFDAEALKAILSRGYDARLRPYTHTGTQFMQVPRQFVLIGTMNLSPVSGYLRESSENRRFCPVRVQRFNLEKLRADRDQLWAEAVHVEVSGGSVRVANAVAGSHVEG